MYTICLYQDAAFHYMSHPSFCKDHGFIVHSPKLRFFPDDLYVEKLLHSTRWIMRESAAASRVQDSAPPSALMQQIQKIVGTDAKRWPHVVSRDEPDEDDDCWGAWSSPGKKKGATASRPPGMPPMMGLAQMWDRGAKATTSSEGPNIGEGIALAVPLDTYNPFAEDESGVHTMVSPRKHPRELYNPADSTRGAATPELLDILSIRCQARQWTKYRREGQAECIIMNYSVHAPNAKDRRKASPKSDIGLMFVTKRFADLVKAHDVPQISLSNSKPLRFI